MLADNARIVGISMENKKYRRSYGILCLLIEARKFYMPIYNKIMTNQEHKNLYRRRCGNYACKFKCKKL